LNDKDRYLAKISADVRKRMGTNPDPNLLRANATDFQHRKVGFNDVVAKGWERRDTSKPRVKKIQLVTPIGETTGVPLMCHNKFFQIDSDSPTTIGSFVSHNAFQ